MKRKWSTILLIAAFILSAVATAYAGEAQNVSDPYGADAPSVSSAQADVPGAAEEISSNAPDADGDEVLTEGAGDFAESQAAQIAPEAQNTLTEEKIAVNAVVSADGTASDGAAATSSDDENLNNDDGVSSGSESALAVNDTFTQTIDGVTYTFLIKGTTSVEIQSTAASGGSFPAPVKVPSVVTNGGTRYIVESVGDNGFVSSLSPAGLKSVVLPDSVVYIGRMAFRNCMQLQSVTLPANLKTLMYEAFSDCWNLKEISIPVSLTEIQRATFQDTGLTQVTIPGSVKTVGPNAFAATVTNPNGPGLESVACQEGVTSLGDGAFLGNTVLTTVKLPATLKKIGQQAFDGCTALATIDFAGTKAHWHYVEGKANLPAGITIRCSDGDYEDGTYEKPADPEQPGGTNRPPQSGSIINPIIPSSTELVRMQKETLDGTNAIRAREGQAPLEMADGLNKAAQVRAEEMASANSMSHTRPNGSKCETVLIVVDSSTGENIVMPGNGLLTSQVAGTSVYLWDHSPGHHANMIKEKWRFHGAGYAQSPITGYWYGCQIFAQTSDVTWVDEPILTSTRNPNAVADPSQVEQAILDAMNSERRAVNAGTLDTCAGLMDAARNRALEIAYAEEWSNLRPDGKTPWYQIIAVNNGAVRIEIRAKVSDTSDENQLAQGVMEYFLADPVQAPLVIDTDVDHAGVGLAQSESGDWYGIVILTDSGDIAYVGPPYYGTKTPTPPAGTQQPQQPKPTAPTPVPTSVPTPEPTQAPTPSVPPLPELPSISFDNIPAPVVSQPPSSAASASSAPSGSPSAGASGSAEQNSSPAPSTQTSAAMSPGTQPSAGPTSEVAGVSVAEPEKGDVLFEIGENNRRFFTVQNIGQSSSKAVTAEDLLARLDVPENTQVQLTDSSGKPAAGDAPVGTGSALRIIDSRTGAVLSVSSVIVKGDILGTGKIELSQLVRMAEALRGGRPLQGAYRAAGDLNEDGEISLTDLVRLAQMHTGTAA